MKNDQEIMNSIRAAKDDCIEVIDEMPSLRYSIDQRAKGEKSVKTKRRSKSSDLSLRSELRTISRKKVIMLVVAVMLALCTTACAISVLPNTIFEQIIDMETESGFIINWSIAEKVTLLDLLSENGWQFPTNSISLLHSNDLSDAEKEKLVDSMITEAVGREDAISHMDIIESVKGPMSTWSLEDKAWYSAYLCSKKELIDSWRDILPGENDLSRDEAIKIAKEAILVVFPTIELYLDSCVLNVSFFTNNNHPDPCWLIGWQDDPYASSQYTVLLSRDGNIMEDESLEIYIPNHVEEIVSSNNMEMNPEYPQGHESQWTLEDKAKWLGSDNGLPSDTDISEDMAVSIAQKALKANGITPEEYELSVWYKVYDYYAENESPSAPFYAIYFVNNFNAPTVTFGYIIDAATGEILNEYTSGDSLG